MYLPELATGVGTWDGGFRILDAKAVGGGLHAGKVGGPRCGNWETPRRTLAALASTRGNSSNAGEPALGRSSGYLGASGESGRQWTLDEAWMGKGRPASACRRALRLVS